jgi:sialate O-acetylesterase
MKPRLLTILAAAWATAGAPAFAGDVKPAAPFTDNMVLQRDRANPVWGTAPAGQQVAVSIGAQKKTATAGADGNWMLQLDPLPAGGPLEMRIEAGAASVTLKNILVGEVWVCSGQSNMNFRLSSALDGQKEAAEANYPQIRSIADTGGAWVVCSPRTAGYFTAVGYFFGRELHKALGVPVGLIHESVGGTSARLWTPVSALEGVAALKPVLEAHQKSLKDLPALLARYEEAHKAWEANRAGPEPRSPARGAPGGLYNSMIQPMVPYGIRGAIWYQGEADAGRPAEYRALFPALIRSWRKAWGQGDFPFLFVQLPNYSGNFTNLRAVQAEIGSLVPNTGMAVTIDIGETKNIHPRNKQDVGRRLALVALAKVYGRSVVHSGPVYDSFAVEDGKVRVKFKDVQGGLVASNLQAATGPTATTGPTAGGAELTGFLIADDDKKFVPALAKIDGDTVVVWSESVPKPAAVRYAWEADPRATLHNKDGLPAAPFRTDDWP